MELLALSLPLDLLAEIRRTDALSAFAACHNERAYLQTELAIRNGRYTEVESLIHPETASRVQRLCLAYRDMFTEPSRALVEVSGLLAEGSIEQSLAIRLCFWQAHLLLLTGHIEKGEKLLNSLEQKSEFPDIWKGEIYAIMALGEYLAGRPHEALRKHYACQELLDDPSYGDRFCQTFNSAMATRTSLKLADGASFEYFSSKLEEALGAKDDLRYRLRHIGYRAMILNQMGESDVAEKYWTQGEKIHSETESALERGQFLIFRGLALALANRRDQANKTFKAAEDEIRRLGSLPLYLAELEIARALAPLAHPMLRGNSLIQATKDTGDAFHRFFELALDSEGHLQTLYREAANFLKAILHGSPIPPPRHSLVVSILQNIATKAAYASSISHFRLIPSFFNVLFESGMELSPTSLQTALKQSLGVRPAIKSMTFVLSEDLRHLSEQPEVENLLKIASNLLQISHKTDELTKSQAKVRELERAAFLVHDLKFFAMELRRLSSNGASSVSRLSKHFDSLIDGFQASLREGASPGGPTLIDVAELLRSIAATASEMTSRKCVVSTEEMPFFVWAPEAALRRLLENLIKNALEASPEESSARIHVAKTADSQIQVAIEDSGVGLPQDLFEAARAGIGRTTKETGSGLGLRSAFECAQGIGAGIKLAASGATGTRIEVYLNHQPFTKGGTPKIIVVDDSSAVIEAWNAFSESSGTTLWAVSPAQVPGCLMALPDSVEWFVLDYDLRMPQLNGLDIARSLRLLCATKLLPV